MKTIRSVTVAGIIASLVSFSAFAVETNASIVAKTINADNSQQSSNILEAARQNGGFSIFLAAVDEAEMTKALSSQRVQYTLYAPTDAAFAKLPKEQLAALLQNKDELRRIVAQHVVLGKHRASDITAGTKQTIWGQPLPVTTHRNLHVNWVKVVATDLESANGIVHAIDNVIVSAGDTPTEFSQQLAEFNAESLGRGNRF